MEDASAIPSFRVLLLEDHEFQRYVGAEALRQCGAAEVLEAVDGSAALDLLATASSPIEMLVCDLNLPGMDGLQFLRHIAEAGSTSSVILISALAPSILRAAEIMARTYGIRIIGVVEKPISRAKLMPLVLRHFGQTRTQRTPLTPMPLAEIKAGMRRQEFLPFFQPKVSMRHCTLVGAEVLVRWQHRELGMIPPGAFIPVMEAEGLIWPMTEALIETALDHMRHWRNIGLEVPLAFNVSVESLSDTGLADRLEALAAAGGVTPDLLTLEVTETVAMTDIGHALESLARCRMKGFELSIDDYGTGFSSMQQLTRLPLSELKIDQTFVTGAARTPILEVLVETSIDMARRLGLKTVAEGIETAEDWDLVARLGCDTAQGFFIGRPMPAQALPEWHRSWRGPYNGSNRP